jgi:uncharacterized membrane protein (DUF485 family)
MQTPSGEKDLIHSESFLRLLMRRQLVLSIMCGTAFLGMLLGLPLANYFLPELMATRVPGGFTLSWFFLGIGFFPAVWLIAWVFINRSIALEEEEVREARASMAVPRADATGGGEQPPGPGRV